MCNVCGSYQLLVPRKYWSVEDYHVIFYVAKESASVCVGFSRKPWRPLSAIVAWSTPLKVTKAVPVWPISMCEWSNPANCSNRTRSMCSVVEFGNPLTIRVLLLVAEGLSDIVEVVSHWGVLGTCNFSFAFCFAWLSALRLWRISLDLSTVKPARLAIMSDKLRATDKCFTYGSGKGVVSTSQPHLPKVYYKIQILRGRSMRYWPHWLPQIQSKPAL